MKKLLLLLTVAFAVFQDSDAKTEEYIVKNVVPGGYFNISGREYFISDTEINANQAFVVCYRAGLQPITLETLDKNSMIKDYLGQNGYSEPFWSEGDRSSIVSPWRWEIKNLDFTYTDWLSGEAPDDYCGTNEVTDHCCMYFDQNGWYGGRCDASFGQFTFKAFCEQALD